MINWKVRIKNKTFWITAIPTIILLVQLVASLFGFTLEGLPEICDKLIQIVNAVFVLLALFGVVTDPTTEGLGDSQRALTYDKPSK